MLMFHVHTPLKMTVPNTHRTWYNYLLLVLILFLLVTLLAGLGLLAADTSGTATTEWRGESEVDVLLGVETDNEGGNVDDLLTNTGTPYY